MYDYDRLRDINDRYVNLSGLPFGLTHAEYKYQDGEFYLIEIGARGGGNLISAEIVPCISGYDNYAALIRMALDEPVASKPQVLDAYRTRCAVLEFFDVPGNGGIVRCIEGEDYLRNNEHILSWKFNFKTGDRIQKAVSDSARIGFYIAFAESREDLQSLMDDVKKNVKILTDE